MYSEILVNGYFHETHSLRTHVTSPPQRRSKLRSREDWMLVTTSGFLRDTDKQFSSCCVMKDRHWLLFNLCLQYLFSSEKRRPTSQYQYKYVLQTDNETWITFHLPQDLHEAKKSLALHCREYCHVSPSSAILCGKSWHFPRSVFWQSRRNVSLEAHADIQFPRRR